MNESVDRTEGTDRRVPASATVTESGRSATIVHRAGGTRLNAIVTVVGNDKVGIIANVSAFLAERSINIEDISQTVLSGNFVMMMMIDLSGSTKPLAAVKEELSELGEAMNVSISVMHERVFSAMHRI